MSRERSDSQCLINASAFSLLFLGTTALALYPDFLNRPLAKAISSLTTYRQFASELAFWLAYPTLQGAIVVSLLCCCWFSNPNAKSRTRLMSGIVAAVLAGVIADLLHRALPTSPKPIFDPMLQHDPPAILGGIDTFLANPLSNLHTFPSPRAAMFCGLAITIFLIRPKLGFVALISTTVPEISRVYLGLHYPNDIVGSFALGAATVWLAQMRWNLNFGRWFARWELTSPSTFYMCAFLACYELTTAFEELRALGSLLPR